MDKPACSRHASSLEFMPTPPPSLAPPNARDRLWVRGQSGLMLAVVGLGITHRGAWQSTAGFVLGAALFGIGALVGIWGVRSLGGNRTPNPTPKPDAELVETGIYRWLRHPLYSSVMFASVGWALLWQSGFALAAAAGLCVFFDAKARLEERLLAERFAAYRKYRQRTRRFVPGIY